MTRLVTDEIDLHKEGRTGHNGRRYVIHAVKAMIESKETQEGLRLGELYGYFGHGRRQLAKKIRPNEVEVVMMNGKPVIVENVPANRTVGLELSESGVLRHTEEIFDTDPGKVVSALIDSQAGGWSWAVLGPSNSTGDHPRQFAGFDYVKKPNFIPPARQAAMQAMFDSVGAASHDEFISHHLLGVGLQSEEMTMLLDSWAQASEARAVEEAAQFDVLMLDGMLREYRGQNIQLKTDLDAARDELEGAKARRERMMLDALDQFPIMLSKEQRQSLINMDTPHDFGVFRMLLDSIAGNELATLPVGGNRPASVRPAPRQAHQDVPGAVLFGSSFKGFK